MNIHEHQAKEILKEYGAPVSNGIVIFSTKEIKDKIDILKSNKFVLKAQIHAGGRGKSGGVKLVNSLEELKEQAENLMGKILVTHQTGKKGKEDGKEYYYVDIIIEGPNSISENRVTYMEAKKINKMLNKIL